jgi:hypothetical protein
MEDRRRTKSRIALGIACICAIFILETGVADRIHPSPASPYIWTALGTAAAVALAAFFRYRRPARRPTRTQPSP